MMTSVTECRCYCPINTGTGGCVASLLSLNEPEGLLIYTRGPSKARDRLFRLTHVHNALVLGGFLYFICRSSLLVYRNYQIINISGCIHSTCIHSYMSLFNRKFILKQPQTDEAPNFMYALLQLGTRQRSWLRHCATSRKIAGSIPDGVFGIFH